MRNNIILVLNTNHNYVPATYLTIKTAVGKSNRNNSFRVYVFLSQDVTREDRLTLKELSIELSNVEINIFDFNCNDTDDRTLFNRIPNVAYGRLFVAEYITEDKCLYLDQDIYINGDIADIFKISIDSYFIAGREDPNIVKHITELKNSIPNFANGITKYVNAGVLIMNLKKMREENWINKVKNLILLKLPTGDQDVLNLVANNKVVYFSEQFNAMQKSDIKQSKKNIPLIIHYAGSRKPWNSSDVPFCKEWWCDCMKTKMFDFFLKEASLLFFNIYMNNTSYTLDCILDNCRGKDIYIFGAGVYGKKAEDILNKKGLTVSRIIVTNAENEKGAKSFKAPIVSYKNIAQKENAIVLIAVLKGNEAIMKMLYNAGFKSIWNITSFLIDFEGEKIRNE